MYSPKELEGEVDHSFFDSDGDAEDSGVSKEQNSEIPSKKSYRARKETDLQPDAPQTQHVSWTKRSDVGTRDPSSLELIPQPATEEESQGVGAEDRSWSSSISSTKSGDGSGAEEVSSIQSKISCDIHAVSSAEEQEEDSDDDEDGYHQSQDESEEESGKPSGPRLVPGPKGTPNSHPKKPVRKLRHRSLSPSSSSSGSETHDSCSSGESCSSEPSLSVDMVHPGSPDPKARLPTTQTFTSSSPRRRPPRLGSAADRKMLHSTTTVTATMEEEEDTVTDVTPLSTPDGSPVQSLDLGVGRNTMVVEAEYHAAGDVGVKQHQGNEGCAATGNLICIPPEEEGGSCNPDLDLALLHCLGSEFAVHSPSRGRNRKNYSFNNDEVRHIDRENQRLLRQLSLRSQLHSPMATSTTSSSLRRSVGRGGGPPPARLYHSALNRQREQQRIEKENLAFLRRLESVRPTRGMKRAEQLADYQRQAGYLGTATSFSAMDRSSSKMEQSSTRMSPGKSPRPGSTNHHQSARASSTCTPTLLP